jgi:hypothetical protein
MGHRRLAGDLRRELIGVTYSTYGFLKMQILKSIDAFCTIENSFSIVYPVHSEGHADLLHDVGLLAIGTPSGSKASLTRSDSESRRQ